MGTLACFLILQTGAQIMCMWIAAKKFFCSISASIFFIVDFTMAVKSCITLFKSKLYYHIMDLLVPIEFCPLQFTFHQSISAHDCPESTINCRKNLRHTSSQFTFFLYTWLWPNKIYDWMQMQSSYDAENVSRLVISIYNMTHPSLSLQALPSEIKVQ